MLEIILTVGYALVIGLIGALIAELVIVSRVHGCAGERKRMPI